MPIFGKSKAAQEVLAQQGDLLPHQARTLAQSIRLGKSHYLTEYRQVENGAILCASNPYEGRCLHEFGIQLWHEQGLGKTRTALEHDKRVREFLRLHNDPRANLPSLIVTINSVKWQIASLEIPRWRSDLLTAGKVVVIDGDKGVRQSLFDLLENGMVAPEIIILTYSHFSKTTEGVFDYLQGCEFLGIYRDEAASQTSNPDSQRAIRLNAIKRGFVVNMAGYPQIGFPHKLWEQLHAVSPGRYGEYIEPPCKPNKELCPLPDYLQARFSRSCVGCKHHLREENKCILGANKDPNPLQIKFKYSPSPYWRPYPSFTGRYCHSNGAGFDGSMNETELNSRLNESGLVSRERWPLSDVPPVSKIALNPSPEQGKLMLRLANGLREWLDRVDGDWENFSGEGSTSFLAAMTHMRRAATMSPAGFKLAYGGQSAEMARIDDLQLSQGSSSKMEWLAEFIDANVLNTDNSILIGSEWTDTLDEIQSILDNRGIEKLHAHAKFDGLDMKISLPEGKDRLFFGRIDGSLSSKQRTAIAETFNQDKRLKIMLLSKAGYEGLNLKGTGTAEDTVFVCVMGASFRPVDIRQLSYRAKRADSVSRVLVLMPVTVNSIEEFVHDKLYAKGLSAGKIIDGQATDTEARELGAFGLREMVGEVKNFLDTSIAKLQEIK